MRRVCLEPGCPTLTDKSRCERCQRERDRARGTRQERGYDSAHDRLRARWQHRLDAGEVVHCWRCRLCGVLTPIDPAAWDLGHRSGQASHPECIPCNRATAGRISQMT